MFREVLTAIRDRVEGTLAVSLIGLDGIAIESIQGDGVPLEEMGAEFGGFVKSIQVSDTEFHTGDVQQLALATDRYITFLSAITPEYFVLLVMRPDGNYGRARFELARAKHLLRDELV
jgi:predicted regulator of Ras-like GTPase activity (Roadblock/LC7/MglB family)